MSLFSKLKKNKPEKVNHPDVKLGSRSQRASGKTAHIYQVIREPHITEKAGLLTEQNKYVFKVYPKANKTEVKKAIETLYRVKVEKVHMVHTAPKKRRLGRHQGWRQGLKRGFKKTIVTLKEGDKIELLPR